jgi:hypothetical protein
MKFGDAMRIAQSTDWIKPRYYEYLKGKRDVAGEQMVTEALLGVPERDRTKSWAASGAGKCLRQRQFSFLGLKGKSPDEHSLNIFLNGTWVHMRHQVVGTVAGYLQAVEEPLVNTELNLRGTMDAVDSTGIPVEYKSINQHGYATVRAFGPKADHNEQLHSYMLAGGFEAGRVVYENKNTNDILEFFVKKDPEKIGKIYRELDSLNKATGAKTLLPMLAECTKKEGQYRWCPFASQCLTASQQLSWMESPVKSGTHPTSSSEQSSLMSPSPPVSLRITTKS